MNKYEFYSKLLQEDFPVKYRQDFAEHDSEQCKKIQDLKVKLSEAVGLLKDASDPRGPTIRYAAIKDFLTRHTQAEQQEAPIPEYFQDACDKFDWTPEEALRFYAEGKHFDTDRGRTRILDTGAIASNALKHASLVYLEMKGDAELSELRAAVGAKQEAQGAHGDEES